MVAKNPEERYQDYEDLLTDLKAIEDGRAPTNTTISATVAVAPDAASDSTVPDYDGEDDERTIDAESPTSHPLPPEPASYSPVQMGILGFLCMAALVFGYSLLNRLTGPSEPGPEQLGISKIVEPKEKKKRKKEERKFESLTDGLPDEVPDAAELLAKEEFEEIKKFVRENPDRIEEAIAGFRALEDGSKLGRRARSERSRLEKQRARIVASQFAQLSDRVTARLDEGDFARANADINNLQGIPESLRKNVNSRSISLLLRRVAEAAVLEQQRVRSDALELANEGKFDEARRTIKKLAELGLDTPSNSLVSEINRIDQLEARAKEADRKELDAAFQVAVEKVMFFVKKRDYSGARKVSAEMAQDPDFAPLKKRLTDAGEDLLRAEAGYNLILKALEANVGRYIEIGRHKGRLAGIRDGRFLMKEGKVEFSPMRVSDLSLPALLKLAERGLRTASGNELLQLAFFWRFEGDQTKSRELLEQARLDGVDIEPVIDRFVPVLIVKSNPPGARIRIFAYPPGATGAQLTGLSAQPASMAPSRFPLQPNDIAEVLITKSGHRFEALTVELGPLGEHEIEVKLKPAGLPGEMKGAFERITSSKDAYGNSVKLGIDSTLGLPREILHKKTGTHLTLIRPGLFQMGASGVKDAGPVHSVLISRPFYMAKYETTRGQFKEFVEKRRYRFVNSRKFIHTGIDWMRNQAQTAKYSWQDPAYEQTDRHPVVIVNRRDVAEYLNWASSGLAHLQLPTEAQWEYACRAGSTGIYFWGDDPNQAGQFANGLDRAALAKLGSNSDRGLQTNDGFAYTAPVGSLKSNAFGLHDMIGNVSEYCSDVFDPNYYLRCPLKDPGGPPSPQGKLKNSIRLIDRGGSWAAPAGFLTCAKRMSGNRSFCSNLCGFRVAVNVPR
jgi:formylglycine-generating enzyme required for sulfatase activity